METLLTIGEVARRAGIRTSALRYYEEMGLLPATMRVQGGHRRYDSDVFQQLAILRLGKQAGLTLDEMRRLVSGFPANVSAAERWQALVPKKLQEVETLLEHLQQTRQTLQRLLSCACQHLEECTFHDEAQQTQTGIVEG